MGALFDMKAFFVWLETASEIELIKKGMCWRTPCKPNLQRMAS
jgi:hypothetical protein